MNPVRLTLSSILKLIQNYALVFIAGSQKVGKPDIKEVTDTNFNTTIGYYNPGS